MMPNDPNLPEMLKTMTDQELSELYCCSIKTIQRWRKRLGVSLKNEGWGPGKLDMQKAKTIRRMYNEGTYTQQELGQLFGVSQALIGRIVNNLVYKEKANIGFGGESVYKVEYFN